MIEFYRISEFLKWRTTLSHGTSVGFVPTMGALHDGHISLVRSAQHISDVVVVSIFVNPGQFGPNEDYSQYPRPIDQDLARLKSIGVDVVFFPDAQDIYPGGYEQSTRVRVPKLSVGLCAKSRPHFFEGVCSIVSRLLIIVKPTSIMLGEKDFQQLIIIKKMASDLFLPVNVVACQIVREADGLALSSRNRYLGSNERKVAASIFSAMQSTKKRVTDGVIRTKTLIEFCRLELARSGIIVEYVEIRSNGDLRPIRMIEPGCRLLVAGWVGGVRLIDNTELVADLNAERE